MSSSCVFNLAEHVVENTSVLEVSDLRVSVESADDFESFARACLYGHFLVNLEVSTLHINVEGFFAGQTVSVSTLTIFELKRKNTHADKI